MATFVAGLLVAFVAALGPTLMLVSAYVENVGNYVTGLPGVLFWSGTYEGAGWLADWTIFYWAWWISWSPFVGMFIARISRGRTIREFVLGVLLVPAVVSFAWFTVFGNTALDMELTGTADIIGPTAAGAEFALFALLEEFPLTEVSALVAVVVIGRVLRDELRSGSFVIEMLASGETRTRHDCTVSFWAVSEGFVPIALLLAGGLAALQAGAVSTGLPFTFVLLVVMLGLAKALRAEHEARGSPGHAELPADRPPPPRTGRQRAGERARLSAISARLLIPARCARSRRSAAISSRSAVVSGSACSRERPRRSTASNAVTYPEMASP
ncbi:MAG: BCCT family transporter [Dehalococcoidia bacterium]|nr:BCCT family transporter [Dehalococcoidia bacterium]